jgi:hypothetical protein
VIFKPGLIEKILAGKKTMTRRPVRDVHALACHFDPHRTTTRFVPGMPYVPGRDYAIKPGRVAAGVARVKIIGLQLELLGEISPTDAVAEGFKRTDDFFAYWERLYGRVDREQWVWVISFELVREERVRYLGRRTGYTDNPQLALKEDPADELADRAWSVDADWQRAHSAERRAAFEQEREQTLEERLASAIRDAEESGVDINRHRTAIAKRVEALERDLRKTKTRASAA